MKKISERKRIVVKVGTSTLTHKTGMLNIRRVVHNGLPSKNNS